MYGYVETDYYCTVTARLKLDYEEWNYPINAPDDAKLIFYMDVLLPMAKGYVAVAENISDVNFKRDAFKKIINLYTAIGIRMYNFDIFLILYMLKLYFSGNQITISPLFNVYN